MLETLLQTIYLNFQTWVFTVTAVTATGPGGIEASLDTIRRAPVN